MAVAWIGFAGALVAALISAVVALRQTRLAERLARLQTDLDAEVHERQALFDRSLHAADVLATYREPLAAAAYDLQSRLYNVLRLDFFAKWGNPNEHAEDAITTTLFRLAQYFGWTEILRRKIQFLSFPEDEETRKVARLQSEIAGCFLTDRYGLSLMIWSDEQRAIGEQMIVEEFGDVLCMGFARFRARCADTFLAHRERLRLEIDDPQVQDRLRDVQHLLCDLIEVLDSRRVRYTQNIERA